MKNLMRLLILILTITSCVPVNTILKTDELPLCTTTDMQEYNYIKQELQGVSGFDPEHQDILFVNSDECQTWSPINGRKVQVTGTFVGYGVHDGGGIFDRCNEDEYDWNLNIVPNDPFKFIIDAPRDGTSQGDLSEWKTCTLNDVDVDCFQAEITPDEHLYENIWFPEDDGSNETSPLEGRQLSVYGPWVRDHGHGKRPEIHPCELIWWKESQANSDTFYLFSIQDDSNRYDDNSDFDFENTESLGFRPWAAFPMTSRYIIPFEFDPNALVTNGHMVMDIEELEQRNVVTNIVDTDNGNSHSLIHDASSRTIIEVNENTSPNSDITIDFVKLCKDNSGKIIGYVEITTKYGIENGEEGYHLLKAILRHPTAVVID